MKLTKSEVIEKLRRLEQNKEPILFSISGRGWPTIAANGEGFVEKVSEDGLRIEGNGRFFVTFGDDYEYELSGHYPHRSSEGSEIFGSSKRVRCMTIRDEYAEANLVFRAGACSRAANGNRRRGGSVVRSIR